MQSIRRWNKYYEKHEFGYNFILGKLPISTAYAVMTKPQIFMDKFEVDPIRR